MLRPVILAGLALALMGMPALAGPAGDTLKSSLYAGTFAQAVETLEPMAAAGDTEASFAMGAIKVTQAVERLAQALYRHGFAVPEVNSIFAPGIGLPVPANPEPAPLDYDGVREIFEELVAGLDDARPDFVAAGASGDYVIEIDPLAIRIDGNGDGRADESESLAGLMALWGGTPDVQQPPSHVGFDRADAYWLAGYTHVLAAQVDFLLAHDFADFVNVLFHRLFPKAGFPMQEFAQGGMLMLDPESDTAIADIIAGIHTLDWQVIDSGRLAGVRERLMQVIEFSRMNWDAILVEADDNHELLPSPTQTAMIPDAAVDDAKVEAWRVTLDQAQRVLEGRLLIPHWRFKQGFDLRAYFEQADETDLVMLLTGPGAVPFLAEGPVASAEDFREIQEAFGNDWLGYAFWFN